MELPLLLICMAFGVSLLYKILRNLTSLIFVSKSVDFLFAPYRPTNNKMQPTPLALDRTASGMVQEFLRSPSDSSTNSAPFTSTPLTSPSPDSPPSPPTPGRAPSEDVFLPNGSSKDVNTHTKPHKSMFHKKMEKSHTTGYMPSELYEIQNERIMFGGSGSSSSSHEDDSCPTAEFDFSTSLPAGSSMWRTISPDPVSTSKSIRTRKKAGGFFTLQRPWNSRRQNAMPIKSQLLDIDIVPSSLTSRSPTPTDKTDPEMRWMRKSAFKKKKRSSSVFGPPIPETSFAFEVAIYKAYASLPPWGLPSVISFLQIKCVHVTTENGATLEIPCRG